MLNARRECRVNPGGATGASGKATVIGAAARFLPPATGVSDAIASARISGQHGVSSYEPGVASSACPTICAVAADARFGASMHRSNAAQTGCRRRRNNAKNATPADRSFDVLRIANALFTAFIAPCGEYAPGNPNALDLGQNPSLTIAKQRAEGQPRQNRGNRDCELAHERNPFVRVSGHIAHRWRSGRRAETAAPCRGRCAGLPCRASRPPCPALRGRSPWSSRATTV